MTSRPHRNAEEGRTDDEVDDAGGSSCCPTSGADGDRSRWRSRSSTTTCGCWASQDRSAWHHEEIREALALLAPLATKVLDTPAAVYQLQALIAAEHAIATDAASTRWDRIAERYAELEVVSPSPVVRLARAVAVAEAEGPRAGLHLLDGLDDQLPHSHRLPAVRAELLGRAGDADGAIAAYTLAIERCANGAELALLVERRDALGRDRVT